jgi:hypothetical protein
MFLARFVYRKKVILSVHEFAPNKFSEYSIIQDRLGRGVWFDAPLEVLRVILTTFEVALRFGQLRLAWIAMLSIPHVVVAHSDTTVAHLALGLTHAQFEKVVTLPLPVESIELDRNEARRRLNLPVEPFAFIIPGFIFRRKRVKEVIEQLPPEGELWVVGVTSEYDPGYLEEIQTYLESSPRAGQVRIIQEYGVVPYIQAADVVVLYYSDIFQSAVASQAVGAGKP